MTEQRPPSFWELAVQATTSTRQGYNLLAPRFEATEYATPAVLIDACRRRVDRLYPIPRLGSRAADLACGTGRACFVLGTSCSEVEGYDFSPGMLQRAAKSSLAYQETSFHFQESDLADLRLPESAYDRVVTFGAWGHILAPWRERLLEQVLRSLKRDGVFYTVTADPATMLSRRWLFSHAFDLAISARNRLLGDPFHMYYLINDTLTVKRCLEGLSARVRLEPVPGSPHPDLTLLMARRSP